MKLSHDLQSSIKSSSDDDAKELGRFLEGPWTIDVICSETDVIHFNSPFIEILDSVASLPKLPENDSLLEFPERYEPMRRRALAYVESTSWIEPVILHGQEPNLLTVESRGSGNLAAYRRFRIEMWRPENERSKILSAAPSAPKKARYLDAPVTLDITCSASDVIEEARY